MSTVLFSPIRSTPEILSEAIPSWLALSGIDEYWCYDDNTDPASTALLKRPFRILPPIDLAGGDYRATEETHHWGRASVLRVSRIKDYAIREFLKTGHERLFLIDADLVVHPALVRSLAAAAAPIASGIFWTSWRPGYPCMPNCWDVQPYSFLGVDSLLRLARPGYYSVGGLGALTLIHRDAFANVDFTLPSLPFEWGEDRAFCLKALACGLPLVVDTHYPTFHIYRPSLVDELRSWKASGCAQSWFAKHWLTPEWETAVRNLLRGPSESRNAA